MISGIALLAGGLACLAPGQASPTAAAANQASHAPRLLGAHALSLQWIGWENPGQVKIAQQGKKTRVRGEQKGRKSADFLRIDGEVARVVSPLEFVFRGRIEYSVSSIQEGRPCIRDGEYLFKSTKGRRYWRLQSMENNCEGVTDYIDIFF
jgi:hypothetical protein